MMKINQSRGLKYITFDNIEKTGMVRHFFSTRCGGVSKGEFESLNLSFTRGDSEENVRRNFDIICQETGIKPENIVMTRQTHTVNVRRASQDDRGKGIIRETDYSDVDGLITNDSGTALLSFSADCVPLFFIDTEKRAIGLSHAGWRGTVNGMAGVTLERMNKEFGSEAKNITAAIGPSIGRCCFQVDEPVAEEFREKWSFGNEYVFIDETQPDRYKIDLWAFNKRLMMECGVPEKNIEVTDLCTMCRPELFYSHRIMGDRRGSMVAVMELI